MNNLLAVKRINKYSSEESIDYWQSRMDELGDKIDELESEIDELDDLANDQDTLDDIYNEAVEKENYVEYAEIYEEKYNKKSEEYEKIYDELQENFDLEWGEAHEQLFDYDHIEEKFDAELEEIENEYERRQQELDEWIIGQRDRIEQEIQNAKVMWDSNKRGKMAQLEKDKDEILKNLYKEEEQALQEIKEEGERKEAEEDERMERIGNEAVEKHVNETNTKIDELRRIQEELEDKWEFAKNKVESLEDMQVNNNELVEKYNAQTNKYIFGMFGGGGSELENLDSWREEKIKEQENLLEGLLSENKIDLYEIRSSFLREISETDSEISKLENLIENSEYKINALSKKRNNLESSMDQRIKEAARENEQVIDEIKRNFEKNIAEINEKYEDRKRRKELGG